MFYLLLMLGLVSTATGVFIIGFGIPIRETIFGSALLMAGTVAITGGFVTLGLAATVAELRSVLQALKARIPAVARPTHTPEHKELEKRLDMRQSLRPALDAPSGEAAPISSNREPHAASQNTASQGTARKPEWLRRAFAELSTGSRPAGPPAAAPDVPRNDVRTEKPWLRRVNPPTAPDLPPPAREIVAPEPNQPQSEHPAQPDIFDMVWPSGRNRPADERTPDRPAPPRPRLRHPEPRPTLAAAPPAEAVSPPSQPERPDAPPPSILKSGVIDEMAYTLFTDGSIEAQMPEGTVRFASIEELRDHLEKHED